jgi:predicted phosphodiesterase
MRYAIISDIHANLEALQAAVADIDSHQVDQVICLGDIVGYYPNPNECVSICRQRAYQCLRGNHDDAATGLCGIENFNPVAQAAILWTMGVMQEEAKEWLRMLPEKILVDDHFLAVHGAPWHPYDYIFSLDGAENAFYYMSQHHPELRICFFGHTHQKGVFYESAHTVTLMEPASHYRVQPTGLYLVNPGSIGQSRDGKPGASYILYDTEAMDIEYRHVPYDLELTQRKVKLAGLPPMLADRLNMGY